MAYQDRLRTAVRRNETLFKSLKAEVPGLGKKVLGAMAGAALEAAMSSENTKHDSSRAAANWDVQVGGANPYGRSTSSLKPSEYGDPTYGIGERHWGGLMEEDVIKAKLANYGYDRGTRLITKGGWLWSALKIGEPGNVQAHLFNPVTAIGPYGHNAILGLSALRSSVADRVRNGADLAAFQATKDIAKKLRLPTTHGL